MVAERAQCTQNLLEISIAQLKDLTPTEQKLVSSLAEHPEGIPIRVLTVAGGIAPRYSHRRDFKAIINHVDRLRRKLGDLQVYRLPIELRLGNNRYVLRPRQEIGTSISIPTVEMEELDPLTEETEKTKEEILDLFNSFTIKNETELASQLTPQERFLLKLLVDDFKTPCSVKDLARKIYPFGPDLSGDLQNLRNIKFNLQRALEKTGLAIFTLQRCFKEGFGAYVLFPRDHFQGEERGEIQIIEPSELEGIDKEILEEIEWMCNRVRVEGLNLWAVVNWERELLLKLAKRYPRGCIRWTLEKLFLNCADPSDEVDGAIDYLRKKLISEFNSWASILNIEGEFCLRVADKTNP